MNPPEKKLFEMRKQLFNAYSSKKTGGGGLGWRSKKLFWKPPPNQPGQLNPTIQKLVAQRFQNIQEWRTEQRKKERSLRKELQQQVRDEIKKRK